MWLLDGPAPASTIARVRDVHVHKRAADRRAEKWPSPQRHPVAVECGNNIRKLLPICASIRLGSTNELLQAAPQAHKPRSSSGKNLSHTPFSGLRSISFPHILYITLKGMIQSQFLLQLWM